MFASILFVVFLCGFVAAAEYLCYKCLRLIFADNGEITPETKPMRLVVLPMILEEEDLGVPEPEPPAAKVPPPWQPAQPAPLPTQRRQTRRPRRMSPKASLRAARKWHRQQVAQNRRWHLSRAA